jgi:hypothetical protein
MTGVDANRAKAAVSVFRAPKWFYGEMMRSTSKPQGRK